MKFFDKLILFFTYSAEETERRWKGFFELIEYLTERLPLEIRKRLKDMKLSPTISSDGGIVEFNYSDLLWWKEKKTVTTWIMKDPIVFKKEIKSALLRIMDDYIAAMGEDLSKDCKKIIEEMYTEKES